MPGSNFPHGFEKGVTIRGVPVHETHPGKVFFVNNSGVLPPAGIAGSDGNAGTYLRPFATIDYAVGKCTAGRGDVIMVMPGHSEAISSASAIDLDVAGVALVGLGRGSLMPKIQFDNAAATVAVGADNVTIANIRFTASVTSVAIGVTVEDGADYCSIYDCVFDVDAEGTDEFLHSIQTNDASNNCTISGCRFDMGIAGAVAAIAFIKDTDRTTVEDCIIRGDYSTACINGTTTLSTNLLIRRNVLENGIGGNLGTEPCIELLTGTTGTIADNYCVCNLATKAASVVADTCLLFENYYNEDISGAATGGIIGAASADD